MILAMTDLGIVIMPEEKQNGSMAPCPQLLMPIQPGVCIMLKQHFSSAFPTLWKSWALEKCPECDPLRR